MGKNYDDILKLVDSLTAKELEGLRDKITPLIALRREDDKARVRAEMERMAQEHGFASAIEVIGAEAKKPRKPRAPSETTYQNPADPALVWTGRGRKPAWVKEALESGKTLDDLKTENNPTQKAV